jgi:antitoxin ParD1/3/4
MNVSLTAELERLVERKVRSGMYQTASEVVREALRLLQERDQRAAEELRAEVAKGIKELEEGRFTSYDEEGLRNLAANIVARSRRRLGAQRTRRSR